jgi:hypothetical protein
MKSRPAPNRGEYDQVVDPNKMVHPYAATTAAPADPR